MLQAAIIGCGVIAPTHAKALAIDGRTELRWACDLDPVRAKALGAQRSTRDYREVLSDPAIDLVCITTPHHLHREMVIAALAAHKHVICEKPLAHRPDDVVAMVRAASAGECMASGIFQHRFSPLARRLHELTMGGEFGRIRSVDTEFRCTRTPAYYASGPWRGRWDGEGGGLLINQAIHTIDLSLWFTGAPLRVRGQVERRCLGDAIEVEDWAEATIEFQGGAVGHLHAANDLKTEWHTRIAVEGELGGFTMGEGYGLERLDHPSQALAGELQALNRIRDDVVRMPGKDCYGDQHALQIHDCITAVIAARPPEIGFAAAAVAINTVLAIYHSSAQGGGPVPVPPQGYTHPALVGHGAGLAGTATDTQPQGSRP